MKKIIPLKVRSNGNELDALKFLKKPNNIFLFGDAGSGKTTVLKMLSGDLGDETYHFIALRHVSWFHRNLQDTFSLAESYNPQYSSIGSGQGTHCIILDGIDELMPEARRKLLAVLPDWIAENAKTRWVLSSRPIDGIEIPSGFNRAELLAPSESDVKHFFAETGVPVSDVERIFASQNIYPLLGNPLILSILVMVFFNFGRIPEHASDIYRGVIRSHLEDWDRQRDLVRSSPWSGKQVEEALEVVALHLFTGSTDAAPIIELIKPLSDHFAISPAEAKELILDPRITWITARDSDIISFVHKSLWEYLAAKAILQSVTLPQLLARRPPSAEIIKFLIELAPNPEEIADLLIAQGQFGNLLTALELTGDSFGRLKNHVIYRAAKEAQSLGSNKFRVGDYVQYVPPREEAFNAIIAETDVRTKGRAFERYMASLLEDEFEIIYLNKLTRFGEFDIVCSPRVLDHFWLRYPSDYFVECKNLHSKSPVSDMNEFIGKALAVGAKLAFFVSMSGFTTYALNSARQTWRNSAATSIVCISADDLRQYSRSDKSTKVFLQELCRSSQFGM